MRGTMRVPSISLLQLILFACIALAGCAGGETPRIESCHTSSAVREIRTYDDLLALREKSPIPVDDRRRIASQIGERVSAKYLHLPYLCFRADSFEPPARHAWAFLRMTPTRLKSTIFLNELGGTEPALEVALRDGKYSERARFGGTWRTVEYAAPYANGSQDVWLLGAGQPGAEYACMFGLYILSWLGDASANGPFGGVIRQRLGSGEFLGQVDLDAGPCSMIAWEGGDSEYRLVQVFFVTTEDLLAGFDTFDGEGSSRPELRRKRRYSRLSTEPIHEEDWDSNGAAPVGAAAETRD